MNPLLLAAVVAFSVWRYATSSFDHAFSTDVPSDLQVYLLGGERVAQGLPLYDGDLLPGLPFTYPPFAGVVFSWLGEPTEALGVAWTAASVVVLGWVVWASKSKCSPVILLTAFFVLCTEPVHATLYFGQVNIFLMALVCLDFLPRYRLPGVGVGLAAGMKLTPAFFVLLLVVQRRFGAVFLAGFTFLCTVATGFAEVPDAGRFFTESMFNSSRVGDAENPGAQAIRQVLHRLGAESTALWLVLAVLATLLAAYAARVTVARGHVPLAVAFTRMAACLVSPFSWNHHWVWIVPLGVAVYEAFGVLALVAAMAPYAAVNVVGLMSGTLHDLLFLGVPVGCMLIYSFVLPGSSINGVQPVPKKGTHHAPHPSYRRGPGGRYRTDPRPRRLR